MKECFLALAVLESWALVFLVPAVVLGRYDLVVGLVQMICVLMLAACLAYGRIEPTSPRRHRTAKLMIN